MGVPQVLSELLQQAGRPVDLRQFVGPSPRLVAVHPAWPGDAARPLRLGVDISTWIYQACMGHGDMLGNEQHLTHYGRAEFLQQQQQQQTSSSSPEEATTIAASNGDQQQQERQQQQYIVDLFVAACTKHVMDRLLMLRELLQHQARILVVMDGLSPPIKRDAVRQRRQKTQAAVQGRDDDRIDVTGQHVAQRVQHYRRAGAGPHYSAVVSSFIQALRAQKIPFLVAPYESDGQLAYLSQQGYLDLIVTEDSDLIASCGEGYSPILYKLSDHLSRGEPCGMLIRRDDWPAQSPSGLASPRVSWLDFSPLMLTVLFVAIGSDYGKKLKGVGLVSAGESVRASFLGRRDLGRSRLQVFFDHLFRITWDRDLSEQNKIDYQNRFLEALLMYRHPVVYDPVRQQCVTAGPEEMDPELRDHGPYRELWHDLERRAAVVGSPTGRLTQPPWLPYLVEGWICPRTGKPYPDLKQLPPGLIRLMALEGETTDPASTAGGAFVSAAARPDTGGDASTADSGVDQPRPDVDAVLAATDRVFANINDFSDMTVLEFYRLLEKEINGDLGMECKKAVRKRLAQLMKAKKNQGTRDKNQPTRTAVSPRLSGRQEAAFDNNIDDYRENDDDDEEEYDDMEVEDAAFETQCQSNFAADVMELENYASPAGTQPP